MPGVSQSVPLLRSLAIYEQKVEEKSSKEFKLVEKLMENACIVIECNHKKMMKECTHITQCVTGCTDTRNYPGLQISVSHRQHRAVQSQIGLLTAQLCVQKSQDSQENQYGAINRIEFTLI